MTNSSKSNISNCGALLHRNGQHPRQWWLLCCLLILTVTGCASPPANRTSVEEQLSRQQRQADAVARESQADPAAAVSQESPAVTQLLTDAESARTEGNFSLANLLLERSLRIAPSQAKIYLGLARLRMDQSLPEQALAFVQRGLALQPQAAVKAELQATGVSAKAAINSTAATIGS